MTAIQAAELIGHELVGAGETRVVIMNDWLCDTSTWDAARNYVDRERFTYAFVDLRGYGRSMGRSGAFTLTEAADDVFALAMALRWERFSVVGHSMSSLVALHLAQHHAAHVERVVVLTPPPPDGVWRRRGCTFGVARACIRRRRHARGDPLRAVRRPPFTRLGAPQGSTLARLCGAERSCGLCRAVRSRRASRPFRAHHRSGSGDHRRARYCAHAGRCGAACPRTLVR